MKGCLLLILIISFHSCVKDRTFDEDDYSNIPVNPHSKKLVINELVAKGSQLSSELGVTSDWIELYNSGSSSINLGEGEWFISDDPSNLEKYKLPGWNIAPNSYLMIFCNDSNKVGAQIHSNFGLSSNGEHVLLSVKKPGMTIQIADSVSFGIQTFDNQSIARTPNGIGNWKYPADPTPGSANP